MYYVGYSLKDVLDNNSNNGDGDGILNGIGVAESIDEDGKVFKRL